MDEGSQQGGKSMTTFDDERGVLHRHADGRKHRHFAAGFTIGGQVIEDHDGTESHSHGTLRIGGGGSKDVSGPVVWHENQTGEKIICGELFFVGKEAFRCTRTPDHDGEPHGTADDPIAEECEPL
jgi:hypothetical protein